MCVKKFKSFFYTFLKIKLPIFGHKGSGNWIQGNKLLKRSAGHTNNQSKNNFNNVEVLQVSIKGHWLHQLQKTEI